MFAVRRYFILRKHFSSEGEKLSHESFSLTPFFPFFAQTIPSELDNQGFLTVS